MCDTLWRRTPDGAIFAKNSDRPARELQPIETHQRRDGGGRVATQYLDIANLGAAALIGARPSWLWGMEHAVNEHGVAIGNERLYVRATSSPTGPQRAGLIGMDIVRLVGERARSAGHGVDIATSLIEEFDQSGIASAADAIGYSSSFLISDAREAYVVETNGAEWVAARYDAAATISNRVGLTADDVQRSAPTCAGVDPQSWIDPDAVLGRADHRLACTIPYATTEAADPRTATSLLRHHGLAPWGPPPSHFDERTGEGMTVCMHWKGETATTSAIVAALSSDPDEPTRMWAAPGAPCVTPFIPIDLRSGTPAAFADHEVLRGFNRRRVAVEHDPSLADAMRQQVESFEDECWATAAETWAADDDLGSLRDAIDSGLRRLAPDAFGTVAR